MVAFNDRRRSPNASVDDVVSRLTLSKGETVGKQLIDDRYLVRGIPVTDEDGAKRREYVLHEVLPTGGVIVRGDVYESRRKAKKDTANLTPTRVIDI